MADNIKAITERFSKKGRLGQTIDEMVNMAAARRRKFERRWYDNNFFDDGYHFRYVSRTTGKIVDLSTRNVGGLPIRAIPKASRQLRGVANLLVALDPHPTVYPEKVIKANYGDEKEYLTALEEAKAIAQRQGHWLVEEWKKQRIKTKLVQMVILAAKHGVSFLQVWPDAVKEEIRTQVYDAFDIYLLGNMNNIQDSPFLIKAIPTLISEIKANENFDKDQLDKLSPDNKYASSEIKQAYMQSRYGSGQEVDVGKTLILKEAFIKEYLTDDNIKEIRSKFGDVVKDKDIGDMVMRHAFSAGGVWLKDEYVDLEEYPFSDFRFEPGPIYQTPLIERFIPTNKSLDLLVSRIERYMNTMVTGHWLMRKGEDITITNIPGGQKLEYSGTPPVQGNIAGLPGTVFNFVSLLEKFIEEQGASTSALGQLPSGVKSGVAIESLKATEYANLKIPSDQLKETTRDISEKMLKIAANHFVTPQSVERLEKGEPDYFDVIGERGAELRKELGEKVNAVVIKKDVRVDIDVESGLAYTMEGKREVMQQISTFMMSLVKEGYINAKGVQVVMQKFMETFKFGATQEFMEAVEEGSFGGMTDQELTKIKIALVEALRDSQQMQVDATKVGLMEAMKDMQGGGNV